MHTCSVHFPEDGGCLRGQQVASGVLFFYDPDMTNEWSLKTAGSQIEQANRSQIENSPLRIVGMSQKSCGYGYHGCGVD
jgi:hypothetical protein